MAIIFPYYDHYTCQTVNIETGSQFNLLNER